MEKLTEPGDAHVAVFALSAEEVAKVVRGGEPLSGDQLEAMEVTERYSLARGSRLAADPESVAVPINFVERVFPGHVFGQRFFCCCIGATWCLEYDEFGRFVYVLKCEYFCFPTFALATAVEAA